MERYEKCLEGFSEEAFYCRHWQAFRESFRILRWLSVPVDLQLSSLCRYSTVNMYQTSTLN